MKHSADVMLDAKTSYGSTALHLSIQQGHIEIVKFLARKSAEQVVHHATDAQGRTALQLASYLGHVDIVQHLIEHCSVDTNVKTTSGCTALHLACLAGRVTVVEYFAKCGGRIDIEATCNAGRTALLWACTKRGNVSVVKALVQAGASLTVVDQCGWTAIHHASHSGHVDIVRYLVDVASVGADEVTRDGDTPLHLASQQGHVKVVQYLLGTGIVSVNKAALEDGAMTLHFASRYGHLDVVKYLVNHTPAKIDAAIHVGWPATQLPKKDAVMTGDFGLIGITHKVSLIGDNDGTTALHVACFHGHVNIVEFLLANCCTHVEESDHKGKNALHYAIEGRQLSMVQRLVEQHNADLDVTTRTTGATLLHLACKVGGLEIVQYLVTSCGANVHAQNRNGKRPVEYARLCRNEDIVAFLEGKKSGKRLLRA